MEVTKYLALNNDGTFITAKLVCITAPRLALIWVLDGMGVFVIVTSIHTEQSLEAECWLMSIYWTISLSVIHLTTRLSACTSIRCRASKALTSYSLQQGLFVSQTFCNWHYSSHPYAWRFPQYSAISCWRYCSWWSKQYVHRRPDHLGKTIFRCSLVQVMYGLTCLILLLGQLNLRSLFSFCFQNLTTEHSNRVIAGIIAHGQHGTVHYHRCSRA